MVLLPLGCTDRKLVAVEDARVKNYDDRVDLEVEFCTREVEDTTFPVKLLLVVDGSGSLQFTDQSALRRVAVRELMTSLRRQNDVYVSTMVFGSNIYMDPQIQPGAPTFVPVGEWSEPAFLGVADVMTNYQGGLAAVQQHLLMDMLNTDPAELARTKYVIIFFSDGSPSPVCCIPAEETVGTLGDYPYECAPEPWETATAGVQYCEGAAEIPVCNQQEYLDNVQNLDNPADAPDFGDGTLNALNELEAGGNYNRSYQIENMVQEIVDLGETFEVGELRMHTAMLYDDTLPDAVKEIYRLNRCRAASLLERMADIGGGLFRDFENGGDIDFLSFNFTALSKGYQVVNYFALNDNALPGEDENTGELKWLPDSDGDGLDDDTEFGLGTAVNAKDSDQLATPPAATEVPVPFDRANWGDGYSDLIEARRLGVGYDPRYTALPSRDCPGFANDGVDRQDLDGDGLNGCEEFLFGSDPTKPDTDGDAIPDALEVRFGLDPTESDLEEDDDFDGVTNVNEVRRGSNPQAADTGSTQDLMRRYELQEREPLADGRKCYTAKVQGMRLVGTEPRDGGNRRGYNDLMFWLAESLEDNPTGKTLHRYACFRAQYQPPSFKEPATGKATLTEDDFIDLANEADLQRVLAGEDLCQGRTVQ